MEQFSMPEDGEFSEEEMDKYVSGVRVYEDRFELLLNLNPDARGNWIMMPVPLFILRR